uniref:Uncharacterized protein n=1 Tax=Candidatus Kentrum sp. LPFa TaxID=2126335 RepID=A0A450VZC8_9GAMM|nr:MAG: hypothetical protein BECKLPF1236B_GA0070989_101226 [Candidatus Kentron sp. LPFa]
MNKRIRQAALELMLLQEKFTRKELDEAFALVSKDGNATLIRLLSAPPTKQPARREANKQTGNGLSKAVQELKETDPERYELLTAFEEKLRQETILPTLNGIRRVGTSFSKEFQAGKSRKEAIPRLMAMLAAVPFDTLQERLDAVVKRIHRAPNDDSYQELAEFLINGHRSNPQRHWPGSEEKRMDTGNTVAMAGA